MNFAFSLIKETSNVSTFVNVINLYTVESNMAAAENLYKFFGLLVITNWAIGSGIEQMKVTDRPRNLGVGGFLGLWGAKM
jgi:hypothetical protein